MRVEKIRVRVRVGNCLVNMNRVTYEVMATYLSSLKMDENKYKDMSTYDGARSSIMHLMKLDNVYPNHKYQEKVCNLLKGFRRAVQQKKVELGLSLDEGKDPLSFAGYNLLCQTFLKNNGSNNKFIFAHCFLTIEWNLMCRADNLVQLNLAHIGWEDDSLVVCIVMQCMIKRGSRQRPHGISMPILQTPTFVQYLHLVCISFHILVF